MTLLYIAAGLIGLLIIYSVLLAPGRVSSGSQSLWAIDYAHRGLYKKDQSIPENSMSAFSEAVAAGYGIELDLNITSDSQIVVFHDDQMLRACGVDKAVEECTFEELQTYRLFGTEEKIPLLTEVLSLIGGRVPLIIELKVSRRYKELSALSAEILDGYSGAYCIESFDPRIVHWFFKNRPNTVRGQLAAGLKRYSLTPFYQGFAMSSLLTNISARPHFVAYRHEDCHRKMGLRYFKMLGGKLVAWTVRETDDIIRCRRFFDAIIFEFFRPQH